MISYGADRRRIDALQVINGLDCMQLSYILEKLFLESFYFSILRATHLITAGSNVIDLHTYIEGGAAHTLDIVSSLDLYP